MSVALVPTAAPVTAVCIAVFMFAVEVATLEATADTFATCSTVAPAFVAEAFKKDSIVAAEERSRVFVAVAALETIISAKAFEAAVEPLAILPAPAPFNIAAD